MTIGPILIRRLRVAATARATQGSAIGQLPSTGLSTWSQTNTPSSPASSAASAISPNATRSANAPNNGIVNPCRTTADPSQTRQSGSAPVPAKVSVKPEKVQAVMCEFLPPEFGRGIPGPR